MLLTLFYMTSTYIQSWRLNSIRSSFVQWLNKKTSLVLYKEKNVFDSECSASYESLGLHLRGVTSEYCSNKMNARLLDLWDYKHSKRGCVVLPMQNVNISTWISIPNRNTYFPIRLPKHDKVILNENKFSLLVEASFSFSGTSVPVFMCQLVNYGLPRAWTADEYFAVILDTDIDHFTKFCSEFMINELYLNSSMEVIRLETVNVFGNPCELLYADKIPILIHSLDENINNENEDCNSISDNQKFHVQMLRKVAQSAHELQRSQDNSIDLDYPPVILVKSNFTKMDDKDSIHELSSCTSEKLDLKSSKCDTPRSGSEDTSASLRVQLGSNKCSLGTNSYYSSETIVAGSLMKDTPFNSTDELDWKMRSKTSLSTAETVSLSNYSRKSVTPVRHQGEQKTGKPPNILVFSESPSSVENIKNSLNAVLRKHRYTVYSLTLNEMLMSPWMQQAVLVVLCGNVPIALKPLLLQYLLNNGGQLLCLCSDLLGVFLPTFKTAEVRPDEIVTFSYDKWNHISLLHHIFCYQPSPKSTKFSMDESPSSTPSTSNVPATVELMDTAGTSHTLQVKILASEATWQTPTLLLASKTEDTGRALFSQVHLELDPKIDSNVPYDAALRLLLLSDLLSKYLCLDCDPSEKSVEFTRGYFLGRHERKLEFLKSMSSHLKKENALQMKNITVQFFGKNSSPPEAQDFFLPVMLYDCPQNFSTVEYFENLRTENLGRLVIYSEIMTSSMNILNGPVLEHGFVAISRQQTSGVGRGGNAWISPDGCAMFSMQLHIPLMTPLGDRLSLLQHIIALSVVSAIRSQPEYEDLNLGLKWPNDIYAGGTAKIGGLIITSSIVNNVAICNAGCALNLSNSLPTTCVNDMIMEMTEETGKKLPKISLEKYFALVFTQLETLLNMVQKDKIEIIFDLYYKYWLHNFVEIRIIKADNSTQTATVIGIDEYGFLKVRGEKGDVFTVQPDGNTFDMMSGLVAPK